MFLPTTTFLARQDRRSRKAIFAHLLVLSTFSETGARPVREGEIRQRTCQFKQHRQARRRCLAFLVTQPILGSRSPRCERARQQHRFISALETLFFKLTVATFTVATT